MCIRLIDEATAKADAERTNIAELERIVDELRAAGWTQQDFARALRDMMEE